ncbi:MAG: hypothetical protein WC979_07675 [Candidatus Pacearchaeota archaeon]|jgi:hypothetical protein
MVDIKNPKGFLGSPNLRNMVDIKNFVLGVAIFILTLSVGIYGISTFYGKGPQYNDFCPNIVTEQECMNASGNWINNTYIPTNGEKPMPAGGGYCEYSYIKCQEKYNDAEEVHARKIFFLALPLGIIVLAVGALVFGLVSVGGGLMFGGVGLILYGVGSVWSYADDLVKFIISLTGLIVVIALAYYANYKWKFFDAKSGKKK